MDSEIYIPIAFRSFQGFRLKDIKEWRKEKRLEIHLEHDSKHQAECDRCGTSLGSLHSSYPMKVKHVRMMDWQVEIHFERERRFCSYCRKDRQEKVNWLCEASPHMTMELAWWINRLTEITSVLAVSKLESLDKKACYQIDRYLLTRLLQGYKIPKVRSISVDEVYARSPVQLKEGENRNDLFLTIVTDAETHKVIWVSESRSKSALDQFFKLLGPTACKEIEIVACDQHRDYARSVAEYCPQATLVWDRYHLVQRFNEGLNDDRKDEYQRLSVHGEAKELIRGKYRHKFLTKAENRNEESEWHIKQAAERNYKIYMLELIKEHFHKVFESHHRQQAVERMKQCLEWAKEAEAKWTLKILQSYYRSKTFWNYFTYKVTSGVSEGINRAIKGLKWQAYGYKDMFYFGLKILQKLGYLNSQYHFRKL